MTQAIHDAPRSIPRPTRSPKTAILTPDHLKLIVEKAVAEVFAVEPCQLHAESRGRAPIALARQVSMYLMHCTFSVSQAAVGRVFARDRTTVGHACKIVEDRRDESSFDFLLANLETIVRRLAAITDTKREY